MISVRVLGPLEVTVDGARADAGGPRQRCVLARLLAGQGWAVSVDRLIEDLYADEAPPKALAALQSYVSHLRRALEPDRPPRAPAGILVTSPPGYALRLGRDEVDAWWFEDEVHQAAELADAADGHARLTVALNSWRGAAFQEFGGLPWADLEASRLDELRLTATERRAEAALRLGHAARVVADMDRLTAEHPLREEAWRLLAVALYQSGRQGDALAALRRARAKLARELGVDLGPTLHELENAILTHAPRLSAPPSARAAGTGPERMSTAAATRYTSAGLATTRYVGRDTELAQVTRESSQAAAGRMRIVLVTGDAGTGKTALADQVRELLAAQGWIVATGRCPEDEGAPAGWPWAEALRQLIGSARSAATEPLARLLADRPPPDGDAAVARFRSHRAVTAYLAEVSSAAPLLVVLDDLHRADGETLAILTSVAADLTAGKILVLATYRPTEADERLSACLGTLAGREPARVGLGGLDTAAAGELIRVTCQRPVDEATARVIAERTGGNPLFIKETARLLDAEGTLAATTEVPAGVREVLQRRIARLPATAQTILRQAAVLGIETDVDVLADVAAAADDVVLDAIEAALLTGLVTEPGAGRIRFAHALVRDTLYASLSRLRRSRLHARCAEAIEKRRPANVTALAYHYAEAGNDPAAAARYCHLAAVQAERRFAFQESARLWEKAIAYVDQCDDAPVRSRLELVLGLVRALAHTGQLARARSHRLDAVRAASPAQDPVLLAQVITAFDVPTPWPTQEYGVTDYELVSTVERTLTQLPAGDHPLRCRLLVTLAFELADAASERGYQAAVAAVEMARRAADADLLTLALNGRYLQSFRLDELDERQRLGVELLAVPGKPVTAEALAHLMLLEAASGVADFDAADQHADAARRIADRYDLPAVAARVSFYQALRTALDGDAATADERYRQAAAEMSHLGMWEHGAGLSTLGRFCVCVTHDRVGEIGPEMEVLYAYRPEASAELYALALAASGRVDQARDVAGPPGAIRKGAFWLFMTAVRGLLAVAIDDRERAELAYPALLPFAARPAGAEGAAITLWPAALILGDLARYLRLPRAEAHYQHALAIARQAKAPVWIAAARGRLPASGDN